MSRFWKAWRGPLGSIALIALGLYALSHLPPDTSLAERQKTGTLRFCVPAANAALLRDPDTGAPRHELRLMEAVADRLGLRLQLVENANMGRSFNPSDWHISRGQCEVLGGGLADSAVNRGFLTLLPTGETVSLVVTGDGPLPQAGDAVGVYLGTAGLDRIRLSRWMRAEGWRARPLSSQQELLDWLGRGGRAVTSSLTTLPAGTVVSHLPEAAGETQNLAFGLWRGDMTLTRAVRDALNISG